MGMISAMLFGKEGMLMQERKFLCCRHCGNLAGMIHDAGVAVMCCGEPMQEPNLVEIADKCRIQDTGSMTVVDTSFPRGMTPQWIYLQTNVGGQRKKTEGFPKVSFHLAEHEEAKAAYCYFADKHIGIVEC